MSEMTNRISQHGIEGFIFISTDAMIDAVWQAKMSLKMNKHFAFLSYICAKKLSNF